MPEILIRCPVTGKDVSTGVALPAEVFLVADFETYPVHCPHCGLEHPWDKGAAYLQVPPEREPSRPGPAR
ncbi:MAG: hypothetical protein IH614_07365 [Desulfuromonadales bacterium]|nr:hypothetical protein [Desulfuromonadales bacterium]